MSGTITVHGQRHYGNEPFTKKNLSLQITLPPGLQKNNFRVAGAIESVVLPNGANQISLSGFAMNASVVALGMVDGVTMQVQVYNLPYDIMAMLAGYGNKGVFVFDADDSAAGGSGGIDIELFASERTTATAQTDADFRKTAASRVFYGTLLAAEADFSSTPTPSLTIIANALHASRLTVAEPISIKGEAKAADLFAELARKMGLTFENNGVDAVVNDPYYAGSLWDQVRELCEDIACDYIVDNGVLAVCAAGVARDGVVSTVSSRNGLIGYPSFDGSGIVFRTIYRPNFQYLGPVNVKSDFPNATGTYRIYYIAHHLSCQMPGGPWETEIKASFQGAPAGETYVPPEGND